MAHLDTHLLWVYALLLAIVFAEIVSVVTPFLPGDSLLFINGALAVNDALPLVAI